MKSGLRLFKNDFGLVSVRKVVYNDDGTPYSYGQPIKLEHESYYTLVDELLDAAKAIKESTLTSKDFEISGFTHHEYGE